MKSVSYYLTKAILLKTHLYSKSTTLLKFYIHPRSEQRRVRCLLLVSLAQLMAQLNFAYLRSFGKRVRGCLRTKKFIKFRYEQVIKCSEFEMEVQKINRQVQCTLSFDRKYILCTPKNDAAKHGGFFCIHIQVCANQQIVFGPHIS